MAKNLLLFVLLLVGAGVIARLLFHDGFPGSAGLAVGSIAPDFSTVAEPNQPVRLGDLRGKVVVLDFWATWCGPCRGMIPHERELVNKLRGKPFAFIGISADQNVNELRRVIKTEQITWPNIFDGPGRELQRLYNIQYYPTIFVLDKAGVIRFKDVRGADLERAVFGLLKTDQ